MSNRRSAIHCAFCVSVIMQLWASHALGQAKVIVVGGAGAPFLKMGTGGPSEAMADAQAAMPDGLMSLSGNPAHGGFMESFQAAAGHHFERAGLGLTFMGIGFPIRRIASVAVTASYFGKGVYEGNRADDWALGLTLSRLCGSRFSVGATFKAMTYHGGEKRFHASCLDVGFLWMPGWLTFSGKREDGFKFGFSLANYDIRNEGEPPPYQAPDPGQDTVYIVHPGWPELPLLFRIGFSWSPVSNANNRLVLALDALHPNDADESLNFGIEDRVRLAASDALILRAGYWNNQRIKNPLDGREFNGPTAGFGFSRSRASSAGVEAGYSWVYEKDAPDRHGVYLRFSR
jgi:hypothetical protein